MAEQATTLTLMLSTGEAIVVDRSQPVNDRVRTKQIVPRKSWTPDIFEFVYFARPESTIDGISVQQCRKRMGRALGDTVTQRLGHAACQQIDVVVPVPESGNVCALALSYQLGIPMDFGIVKNAYSTRTFILPNAAQRLKGVSRKLSVVKSVFAGKNVLIVDDSIVRGGTSREIVRMARRAGAKNVIFVSGSPAIKCVVHVIHRDLRLADARCLEKVQSHSRHRSCRSPSTDRTRTFGR